MKYIAQERFIFVKRDINCIYVCVRACVRAQAPVLSICIDDLKLNGLYKSTNNVHNSTTVTVTTTA